MLREKLNTLSHENCRYKENWRAKELLLKLSEVTEKQCGILQDWQILWYRLNFQFCQHSFTLCQEACPLPFQALVLTLMHKSVITPLLHIIVHNMSRDPQPLCFPWSHQYFALPAKYWNNIEKETPSSSGASRIHVERISGMLCNKCRILWLVLGSISVCMALST